LRPTRARESFSVTTWTKNGNGAFRIEAGGWDGVLASWVPVAWLGLATRDCLPKLSQPARAVSKLHPHLPESPRKRNWLVGLDLPLGHGFLGDGPLACRAGRRMRRSRLTMKEERLLLRYPSAQELKGYPNVLAAS
jgi:hypothetical protein